MPSSFTFNDKSLHVFIKKAQAVIMAPAVRYPWVKIVEGVPVERKNGIFKKMWAASPTTFRAFHNIDKNKPGAAYIFRNVFISHKNYITSTLADLKNEQELHTLENNICNIIRSKLTNIKNDISSYGKIRKPVDLHIMNLVCMSFEMDKHREKLVPLLFVGLDSQIFSDINIFSDAELKANYLSRLSTYKHVSSENSYITLQELLSQKANKLCLNKMPFYRIYFEMLWGNRHNNWGRNLFETNPFRKNC